MYDLLQWGCMISALLALCYTFPRLVRNPTDKPVVAICVYFACSFLSFFLSLDFISPRLAHLVGYRNITTLLIHCIVVVLTAAQQVVLTYWSYPLEIARDKARRRVAAFGLMLAVLIAMFVFALPERRHNAETATLLNLGNQRYAVYLFLYIAVVAAGQVITVRLSVRYAGIAQRAWLRGGMWIVAAGAGFILAYCAIRDVEIIGVQSGVDMARWDPAQWLAGDVGSLLELVGWTIPGWGPVLSGARRWGADYRAYRKLYPLWAAIYETVPVIAKEPPPTGLLLPRDLEHRLYRRVIEILDGQLALRPFLHPNCADDALRRARESRLEGEALQTMAEALRLRAALGAKAGGLPAREPAGTFSTAPVDDLRGQIRWLTMVAEAFTRTRPVSFATGSR
jgi:hypothetical protein